MTANEAGEARLRHARKALRALSTRALSTEVEELHADLHTEHEEALAALERLTKQLAEVDSNLEYVLLMYLQANTGGAVRALGSRGVLLDDAMVVLAKIVDVGWYRDEKLEWQHAGRPADAPPGPTDLEWRLR